VAKQWGQKRLIQKESFAERFSEVSRRGVAIAQMGRDCALARQAQAGLKYSYNGERDREEGIQGGTAFRGKANEQGVGSRRKNKTGIPGSIAVDGGVEFAQGK